MLESPRSAATNKGVGGERWMKEERGWSDKEKGTDRGAAEVRENMEGGLYGF